MKVYRMAGGQTVPYVSLAKALNLDFSHHKIISVVGAGGKTSLIYALASEIAGNGYKVIVTTTTHMYIPKSGAVLSGKISEITQQLERQNIAAVGTPCGNGKMSAVGDKLFNGLNLYADVILIEADGAKRLPLKAPNENEPVIPKRTGLVIGVAGLDALGRKISETCHRPLEAANLLGTNAGHLVTACDIAKILSDKRGQKKGVNCRYIAVINKADNENLLIKAKKIAEQLRKINVDSVITSLI